MKKENRLYNCPLPIVGITGGIATGKSTVSEFYRLKDQTVIDADFIVKRIYQKSSTLDWLQEKLPYVLDNKIINFKKLREVFFNNEDIKNLIEAFIYPQMESIFLNDVDKNAQIIFYDVPLLFEKKINLKIDKSLVVSCKQDIQIQRVCKRDKISSELASKIIAQQMPLKNKVKLCDYHIDNSFDLETLKKNSYLVLEEIQKDII